jgi:hypothetical protein
MSVESEIQKAVAAAVENAMKVKSGPLPGLPILALLVGAPMIKSREATLIDSLLGMLVGSLIDRGDSDEQIRAKFEQTLRALRSALADPELLNNTKKLVAAMEGHRDR